MSAPIETTKDFQERMFEKIRSQIGDLMTQEDLKKIVEAACKKAFFEPVTINHGYGRTEETPPHFVKLMTSLLEKQVNVAVAQWVQDHPAEIEAVLKGVIEKGIVSIVTSYFDQRAHYPLRELADKLVQKGVL